jgi:hypothetical protein
VVELGKRLAVALDLGLGACLLTAGGYGHRNLERQKWVFILCSKTVPEHKKMFLCKLHIWFVKDKSKGLNAIILVGQFRC